MSLTLETSNGPVHFGSIINTPWARGFCGEPSRFFPFFAYEGACWDGITFASKTVTLYPYHGNVPLNQDGTQKFWFSRFVYWHPLKDFMVNAYKLSNPGLVYCLNQWESQKEPFIVSIISLRDTLEERLTEICHMADLFRFFATQTATPFAIQFNGGCVNAGAHNTLSTEDAIKEIIATANFLRAAGVPIIFNCSPVIDFSILEAVSIYWDALWPGNVIPWGHPCIDWTKITKNGISPLKKRGLDVHGGYSGPAAIPVVTALIRRLFENDIQTPVIASNGIRFPHDVVHFFEASPCVKAVAIGSIVQTNPHAMLAVKQTAWQY